MSNFSHYFLNGQSDITFISIASSKPNAMDSKFSVPKQIQPLERLQRIRKEIGKDVKILTISTNFNLFEYLSDYSLNKELLSTRLKEIDQYIRALIEKQKLNPNRIVLVNVGESTTLGFFLYFVNRDLYRNQIIINPYYDFYVEVMSLIKNPINFKKYLPLLSSLETNFNDEKFWKNTKLTSKLNLFIYSQGNRFKFINTVPANIAAAQNKLLELFSFWPKSMARSFYLHFKQEEKPRNYKSNIKLFMDKYFFSDTNSKQERDPNLREILINPPLSFKVSK